MKLLRVSDMAVKLGIKPMSVYTAIRRKSGSVPKPDYTHCPSCGKQGPLWRER